MIFKEYFFTLMFFSDSKKQFSLLVKQKFKCLWTVSKSAYVIFVAGVALEKFSLQTKDLFVMSYSPRARRLDCSEP